MDEKSEEPAPDLSEAIPPRSGLSTRRIVVIALGVVLGVGLILGAMSWFSTAPDRIEAQERIALDKSWNDAQSEKAEGVDFELQLRPTDGSSFEISFDHSGSVTATDGCYQSSSDYIVLNDGSLALRDLSSAWKRSDGGDCDEKPSDLFWMSRLSYGEGSWVARDAGGSTLSPPLRETSSSMPSSN